MPSYHRVGAGKHVVTGLPRNVTLTLQALAGVVGLALIVRTLSAGGGPLSVGFLLGILLVAVAVLRTWLALKR